MINKILIVFGTRPEAIKMATVVNALKPHFDIKVCITAQHRQMLDQVLDVFDIQPDIDLNVMKADQDLFDVTEKVLKGLKEVLLSEEPDLVLVHGDTTTAMCAALAAFYMNIPVGHVEAGLRTYDIRSPFPEEFNRQTISKIAEFNFAPTENARNNLISEGVDGDKIYVVGNTVIDALLYARNRISSIDYPLKVKEQLPFLRKNKTTENKIILITGHRRENFGDGFKNICEALKKISEMHPNVELVYPVHLNPNVQKPVNEILNNIKNVHLIEPLDYLPFIKLMEASYMILTDSGGIQEEAPSLGKPVLVMRENTERPEAIKAGTVKLVGTKSDEIVNNANILLTNHKTYKIMSESYNPYGDGKSSSMILKILNEERA